MTLLADLARHAAYQHGRRRMARLLRRHDWQPPAGCRCGWVSRHAGEADLADVELAHERHQVQSLLLESPTFARLMAPSREAVDVAYSRAVDALTVAGTCCEDHRLLALRRCQVWRDELRAAVAMRGGQ